MGTVAITAIVVGSLFAYMVIGGVIWHVVKDSWDEVLGCLGAWFWPTIPFVFTAMWLAKLLSVRLPAWIVARSRRTKLPRAEVRRG